MPLSGVESVAALSLSDVWLFVFSLLGLFLVPAALGRAVWFFPAAFAALSMFLIFAPPSLHPFRNPWTFLLLSQGAWALFALDLFARGRAARLLETVPVRALVALALFRWMGLRHVYAGLTGELPAGFALGTAAGELLTAGGALVLWTAWRPGAGWHRVALVLWNTWGLMTALGLGIRVARANPGLSFPPFTTPSYTMHGYFAQWPDGMETFLWIPLAICLHAAVFYKLLRAPAEPSQARLQ